MAASEQWPVPASRPADECVQVWQRTGMVDAQEAS